jgi:hypothetical protein
MKYELMDYRKPHELTKSDFGLLIDLTRQIIGEQVLFGRMAYPDEMTLHFGSALIFKGPRGVTLTEGTYVLGAVASAWQVKSANQGVFLLGNGWPSHKVRIATAAESDRILKSVSGSFVRDVSIFQMFFGYSLRITLSDGSFIEIQPSPDDFSERHIDEDFPISPPDWELFTPYNHCLQVGPGTQWSYLPSDEPEGPEDQKKEEKSEPALS